MPPLGDGSMAPAMPGQVQRSGKEERGRIVAGLGLEMLRMAIAMFQATSDEAITLSETSAKLGKMFKKPPEDLGQAELKFMGSQLFGGGQRPNPMASGPQIQASQQAAGMGTPMPPPGPSPIPTPQIPQAA